MTIRTHKTAIDIDIEARLNSMSLDEIKALFLLVKRWHTKYVSLDGDCYWYSNLRAPRRERRVNCGNKVIDIFKDIWMFWSPDDPIIAHIQGLLDRIEDGAMLERMLQS